MSKPAPTEHPVHPFVVERWSPRAISPAPVSEEVLRSLFEAARWAPSCYNEQPWAWIVATTAEPEEHAKLLSCLVDFNQMWAKTAPILAVAITRDHFLKNGSANLHAGHDLGQAAAWLTVEATSRGLVVHQMGGLLPDKVRELYQVPAGWTPLTALAIGEEGDPATLPEALQGAERAPRTRRPLAQSVFTGAFGRSRSGL